MKQASFALVATLLFSVATAEHRARHGHRHAKRDETVIVTHIEVKTTTTTTWVDPGKPTDHVVHAKAYGEDRSQVEHYVRPKEHRKKPETPKAAPKKEIQDVHKQDVTAGTNTLPNGMTPEEWQQHQIDLQQANIDKQNGYVAQQNGGVVPPPANNYVAPVVVPSSSSTQPTNPGPTGGTTTTTTTGGGSGIGAVPGKMTYYDTVGDPGACELYPTPDTAGVAMAESVMGGKAKCGAMITIHGPAGDFPAKVVDKCGACEEDYKNGINHIDVPRMYALKVNGDTGAFAGSKLEHAGFMTPMTWSWA